MVATTTAVVVTAVVITAVVVVIIVRHAEKMHSRDELLLFRHVEVRASSRGRT